MILGERINKWRAALTLETRNAGFVHSQIDRAVENEPEHQALGINAGAAEHPFHGHGPKRREQFVNEVGVQANDPP